MHGSGLGNRPENQVRARYVTARGVRRLTPPAREHLYRHHYSFACSRCYRCFSDDKGLVAHENQGTCRRVGAARKPDGLDAEKVKQLRRRKREANKPEDKKWKEMYRIVFPKDDTNAIPSPCSWALRFLQTTARGGANSRSQITTTCRPAPPLAGSPAFPRSSGAP